MHPAKAVVFGLLALAATGCVQPETTLALRVDSYQTLTSLDRYEDDGARLRISCDGGPVHLLVVSVAGFPDYSMARSLWRLVWSDDSTTVVVFAEDRPVAAGRQADLYACSKSSPRIVEVVLRDSAGTPIAVGQVDSAPTPA